MDALLGQESELEAQIDTYKAQVSVFTVLNFTSMHPFLPCP